jgi:hypothetical protein
MQSDCSTCPAPCGGKAQKRTVIDRSNVAQAQHGAIGKMYFRRMSLPKGGIHNGHAHFIDHVSIVYRGTVLIEWRNEKTGDTGEMLVDVPPELIGGVKLNILADVWHKFTALSDQEVVWDCVFAQPTDAEDKPVTFHQERPISG